MAKTTDNVMNFLNDLSAKLTPLQKREMDAMLQLKKKEECETSDKLHPYDMLYYRDKVGKLGSVVTKPHHIALFFFNRSKNCNMKWIMKPLKLISFWNV